MALAVVEAGQHRGRQRQQRVGQRGHVQGAAVVLHGVGALGLRDAVVGQGRMRLGPLAFAEAAGLAHRALPGQHQAQPLVPMLRPQIRRQVQPVQHLLGQGALGCGAVALHLRHQRPERGGAGPVGAVADDAGVVAEPHAQRAAQAAQPGRAGHCQDGRQVGGVGAQHRHQPASAAIGHLAGQFGQRGRVGIRHRLGAGAFQLGVAVGVLHQAEMRRQLGLQREAAQQGLAERVDGIDPHAAGQVQHRREQRPRPAAHLGGGGDAALLQFGGQGGVVQHHPLAQHLLQPQRHFGRRRLGEGQAQNAAGLGAGQHQPQQPVDQQLGLAGPGRGRDERRHAGVGRLLLPGGGVAGCLRRRCGVERGVHSASSPAAHSATRASWV